MANPNELEKSPSREAESRTFQNPFARGIQSYLSNSELVHVLRPHQSEVFGDFASFFENGNTRGYVTLPTGTGKTVLFVELSKALLSVNPEEARPPRILVVTPTKDLVTQTLGRTGEKGYGKFAPELKVGSFYTHSSQEERKNIQDYSVVVTTYASLNHLSRKETMKPVTNFEEEVLKSDIYKDLVLEYGLEIANTIVSGYKEKMPSGHKLLEHFDVIFLDEAHHAIMGNAGNIVDNLPKDKVVIGFTATPEASEIRSLRNRLPHKIHELKLNEAADMGLIAPISPIGVASGVKINGSDLYNSEGEFLDSRLAALAFNPERNRLIVEAAKVFSDHGIGTIISCIAGGEVWHARHIAELLLKEGIRAKAVYSGIEGRDEIYRQFESGELDVLTYVGMLSEGWDSSRAKGLIIGRPTRSFIVAKQRLGRITRPGNNAFVIDIQDSFEGNNPPITTADVFEEREIALGATIGEPVDSAALSQVLTALKDRLPVLPRLTSEYQGNQEVLLTLPQLKKGRYKAEKWAAIDFAIASVVNGSYGKVTDEILTKLELMHDTVISKMIGRVGNTIRTAYNTTEASRLLYNLPTITDPRRYFIDENQSKWISAEGLAVLFGKRFPKITPDIVQELFDSVGQELNWIPTKFETSAQFSSYRKFQIVKMYEPSPKTVEVIQNLLAGYFANHPKR